MFANFAPMFATRLVAFRFIIGNGIPDLKITKVCKRILEVEQRYLQSSHHLSECYCYFSGHVELYVG